jgi:two-component system, cell cycle sensor histidine kinase and response regulator CckA
MSDAIRILIVDDEKDFGVLIGELLSTIRGGNYQLDWVGSYDAALAVFEADQHDVWLVDYHLGGHDGLELMREARARGCRAPMILLTGHGSAEVDLAAMKIGASDYLPKDRLDGRTLERTIRYAMERARAQDSLQASEARFRSAFYGATTGMALTSPDGRFLQVNRSLCGMLGYTVAELLGKTLREVTLVEEVPAVLDLQEALMRGAAPVQLEKRFLNKQGIVVWTLWSVSMLRDRQGAPSCFFSQIHDLTQRKQTEEALRHSEEQLHHAQKMEAIGRLAGGVAHDFNNVLTVISGYATILARKLEGNPALRHETEEIQDAIDRAAALTRQLLALSRKQPLKPTVLNLNGVIGGIEKMLRRLIGEDIELRMDLDPAAGRVRADAGQIEQGIMNLAINARDAMPSGGKLTIKTALVTQAKTGPTGDGDLPPGQYTAIIVSDTGVGMTEEVKSHLFEPFFTTKAQGKGTGLGLATCYGIVKQSGGYIQVDAEPNRGATFKIYLPVVTDPIEEPVVAARPVVVHAGKETVLVVEDEDSVRGFAVRLLSDAGYTTLQARNGVEAMRLFENPASGAIDLMVADVIMPQMGGRELAERVRQMRPKVRILFISGYAGEVLDQSGVLQAGAAFLPKPFTPTQLTQKIREVLDGGAAQKR